MKFLMYGLMSLLITTFLSCKNTQDCSSSTSAAQKQDSSSGCSGTTTPTDPTTPTPTPDPDPTIPEPDVDVPVEASLFDTSTQFTNFSAADQEKVNKALKIIKTVIRTSEFRDRVINFAYQGANRYVDSNKSPEEIYQSLLDGAETLKPEVNHVMDLNLELYYSLTSTVGYTYPDVLKIWMNTKYFNSYTAAEVAGNIFHEWTHKLGYDHASSYSVSRDSSVPYALGYLMEELGAKVK